MPQAADIEQITVSGNRVGIIGLTEALEEAAASVDTRDENKISELLLQLLSKRNYIPIKAKEQYKRAFFREYRKRILREEVEEDRLSGIEIKVLGPGCANCERLSKNVMEAVQEAGVRASIDHVKDIREIGSYGVAGSPALVIDGKVRAVGKVPSKEEILRWLKELIK